MPFNTNMNDVTSLTFVASCSQEIVVSDVSIGKGEIKEKEYTITFLLLHIKSSNKCMSSWNIIKQQGNEQYNALLRIKRKLNNEPNIFSNIFKEYFNKYRQLDLLDTRLKVNITTTLLRLHYMTHRYNTTSRRGKKICFWQ